MKPGNKEWLMKRRFPELKNKIPSYMKEIKCINGEKKWYNTRHFREQINEDGTIFLIDKRHDDPTWELVWKVKKNRYCDTHYQVWQKKPKRNYYTMEELGVST